MDPSIPTLPGSAPHEYRASRLWAALRRAALRASRTTLQMALTLFFCLRDQDTPRWAKGVIVGALGYLILPLDAIPDLLPGVGYGDDWGAIAAALATVGMYIKPEHRERATELVDRLLGACGQMPAPPEFSP